MLQPDRHPSGISCWNSSVTVGNRYALPKAARKPQAGIGSKLKDTLGENVFLDLSSYLAVEGLLFWFTQS